MRRARLGVAAACAAALIVSGCGSDPTASSSDDGPAAPSSSSSGSEQGFPSAGTAGEVQPIPADELDAALLGLDALPAGYSQDPDDDDSDSPVSYCGAKPDRAQDHVTRSFTKGGGLSTEFAQVGLSQYADTGTAQEQFETFQDGVADCPGETVAGAHYTYQPASTPETGYPTLGLRVEAESFTLLLFASQVGPTVVTSGTGGVTSVDTDLAEELLRGQIESYQDAAGD